MLRLDYIYIRAYGSLMHSSGSYISEQLRAARAQNAPLDVVIVDSGKFIVLADLSPINRTVVERLAAGIARGSQ